MTISSFSEKGFPQTGQIALEYLFKQEPLLCGFSKNEKRENLFLQLPSISALRTLKNRFNVKRLLLFYNKIQLKKSREKAPIFEHFENICRDTAKALHLREYFL